MVLFRARAVVHSNSTGLDLAEAADHKSMYRSVDATACPAISGACPLVLMTSCWG